MDKPTIEQTAWVFRQINECWKVGGSYRYLIYNLMEYGCEAYVPLYEAGGMNITNMELEDEGR